MGVRRGCKALVHVERRTMRKVSFVMCALLVVGLFMTSIPLSAQSSGDAKKSAQKTGQAAAWWNEPGSNMILVFPGLKQTFTFSNPDEQRIANKVRHEIAMLPYYTLYDIISFRVDGDTVILGGEVVNPTLKGDAEGVVKHVEGVKNVINRIDVLPLSPDDYWIRIAEARTIFSFGGLSRYGWEAAPAIHILVKSGHVRLVGVVDSEADKDAAGIRANSVPGVFSVTNDLQVAKT